VIRNQLALCDFTNKLSEHLYSQSIYTPPHNVSHLETRKFDKLSIPWTDAFMKTITVREMKAHWSEVEAQVREGETFEVINRGRPTVRIIPAAPRRILTWDDHLATAIPASGRSAEDTIAADREGRW
jgi:prevent-host-death family protein